MSDSISDILAELRQDHRNMAALLNILEREADRVYDEATADFELVADIMHYMTVYPDAVHHPKEDRLYAELKAARPDLSVGMARVTSEHRTIAEQSLELRSLVERVTSGDMTPRKLVVSGAVRYIDTLRRHMHWEEKDLFRRIDRMVADGHATIAKSQLIQAPDPLFGSEVDNRFDRLLASINQAAV